jgi:hypothetical protein
VVSTDAEPWFRSARPTPSRGLDELDRRRVMVSTSSTDAESWCRRAPPTEHLDYRRR